MTNHPGRRAGSYRIGNIRIILLAALLTSYVSAQSIGSEARPMEAAAANRLTNDADTALRQSISSVFDALRRFENVAVNVRSGFVILSGEVAEENDKEDAGAVARRFDGVSGVENDINVSLDILDRGGAVYERLQDRLNDLLVSIPLLIIAIAVFVLFLALSKIASRHEGFVGRLTTNQFQRQLLSQTVRVLIIVAGLILALEILDATSLIGAVLGAAGVTGIVLGFALKETIGNYVAGLLLSLRQPFSPFDHVHVLDYEGYVIRLTSRATILMTLDGNHVRVPNADVFKSAVTNYSRNPERRFQFDIGIGVDVDIIAARKLATETLRAMPSVLQDPEPDAWIETLGDSNVVLRVLGWIDQREYSLPKVRSEAIRLVKSAFEAADFDLPEPIYRLKVMEDNEAPLCRTSHTPLQPGSPPEPQGAKDSDIDVTRDTHLEREVEKERSDMPDGDLLNPQARRE